MKKGPFKMKKFSGFGNSPVKQTSKEKFDLRQASKETAKKFVEDPRIARKKTTSTLERMTKAFTNTSKQLFKLGTKETMKKVASKAFLPAAVAVEMRDMYKSGQKHSGGKAWKGQKTGIIKPQGDFWKKAKSKTKSIYKK